MLAIEKADDLSCEEITRGLEAAQTFFNQHSIIPSLVYKHVKAASTGGSYVSGFVELWDVAGQLAIKSAFGDREPTERPTLVWTGSDF